MKQIVGNLPTNCLSVFDHFVEFKGSNIKLKIYLNEIFLRGILCLIIFTQEAQTDRKSPSFFGMAKIDYGITNINVFVSLINSLERLVLAKRKLKGNYLVDTHV